MEGRVTPVILPSSRGPSAPGSPATGIMVNTTQTCSFFDLEKLTSLSVFLWVQNLSDATSGLVVGFMIRNAS